MPKFAFANVIQNQEFGSNYFYFLFHSSEFGYGFATGIEK
jgi:hypothetical protein